MFEILLIVILFVAKGRFYAKKSQTFSQKQAKCSASRWDKSPIVIASVSVAISRERNDVK